MPHDADSNDRRALRHASEYTKEEVDEQLDEALLETFPASDPVSISGVHGSEFKLRSW